MKKPKLPTKTLPRKTTSAFDDPIVAEVRAARQHLLRSCGNSLPKLFKKLNGTPTPTAKRKASA
jgi:hypothetical protein